MASKNTKPPDLIVLEPRTQVTSHDKITWAIQRTVGGSIAHHLYGDDQKNSRQYYKGKTARDNKTILRELSNQVYSYIDGTISEYSDLSEYLFRIWIQLYIDRISGKISERPLFDVEIFRYVGQFSARPNEEKFLIDIKFIAKKDEQLVFPYISKFLRKIKSSNEYINLETFEDPDSVNEELKKSLIPGTGTLVIDTVPFPVKSMTKGDETQVYLEDSKGKKFVIKTEKDLQIFISKEFGVKPDIIGTRTAFQPVDDNIVKISQSIKDTILTQGSTVNNDLIQSLRIDESLTDLEGLFKSIGKPTLVDKIKREYDNIQAALNDARKKHRSFKAEYQSELIVRDEIIKEHEKGNITFEDYRIALSKSVKNIKGVESELIELQKSIKERLATRVKDFINRTVQNKTQEA